jgi:hypothetical protein
MIYSKAYTKYSKAAKKIAFYREKGDIYRHLFSLPFRWSKMYYAGKTLDILKQTKKFPVLNNQSGIIVSLTSFPARISTVHLVIKSLLQQTLLPEKILLWLSDEDFPERNIPVELKNLCQNGLEIVFVSDNLRSHKKYFYAFEKYADKKVITVDDDLLYAEDTLERLEQMSRKYPKAVCANVIRGIAVKEGDFLPYKQWKKTVLQPLAQSLHYVAIGYGGVLYPPHCFDREIFDTQTIKTKCFLADDLWLKANELRMNIPVASGGEYFAHPVIIPRSQKISLQKNNNSSSNRNNDQWKSLREHFALDAVYLQRFFSSFS